ncbi:Protein Fam47E [Manis pentadactyla]|nr:Protein Fam47E [Manis pentadactyla]
MQVVATLPLLEKILCELLLLLFGNSDIRSELPKTSEITKPPCFRNLSKIWLMENWNLNPNVTSNERLMEPFVDLEVDTEQLEAFTKDKLAQTFSYYH